MTEEEIRAELQSLKEQLALLQKERADVRKYWMSWLRATGLLLAVYGGAILLGVFPWIWKSHAEPSSNPIAIMFLFMGIFILAPALWLLACSLRPVADMMMRAASRQ